MKKGLSSSRRVDVRMRRTRRARKISAWWWEESIERLQTLLKRGQLAAREWRSRRDGPRRRGIVSTGEGRNEVSSEWKEVKDLGLRRRARRWIQWT